MIKCVAEANNINKIWVQNFHCSKRNIVGSCPISHWRKNTVRTYMVVDWKSRDDLTSNFLFLYTFYNIFKANNLCSVCQSSDKLQTRRQSGTKCRLISSITFTFSLLKMKGLRSDRLCLLEIWYAPSSRSSLKSSNLVRGTPARRKIVTNLTRKTCWLWGISFPARWTAALWA